MPETLLSPSNLLLFGRVVEDLQIRPPSAHGKHDDPRHGPFPRARGGTPGLLERQLQAEDANFARIYGFAFEGLYHVMPRPALFLVHGPGLDAGKVMSQLRSPQAAPAEAMGEGTGEGARGLPQPDDLMVWSYDKADYSIRLDVRSGMFEQLLLDPRGGPERGMSVHGMSVRGMSAGSDGKD
ncbi:hypothetical protein ACDP63_11940 [Paracoccus sp. P2]|uniref:Uncharacterized protein n=1 Tax=Paracoccus pantotrophus TaxID=82367 RepID=A0A1I5GWM8_PARPN|nr:hypothetical protein [Paracoccus pantotrophus]MDF3854546.1 hypothetical protein [Paracoccus pantotrophus]QFG38433.1 hypothetical protein ESD82_20660 [Paracoccus pantotrophus]QLH15986.1 hypothetical protein HYQ43_17830 [Paracoccus pantotrophus]RDD93298.1 hypothetical protein DTW92_19455 [Paracoccus pantotrophus]RKS51045.1 hypothetical protein BDE18_0271 [Paracoccus pantotrophus]